MVDYYRRNGGPPETLPTVAYTDDHLSRTDLANQPESRDELGFAFFASINPETQRIVKRGDAYLVEIKPPEQAPISAQQVTMRQAQIALLRAGLLDQAEQKIAAMEGVDGRLAQIEWAKATVLRRDHPLVVQLGVDLGLSDDQIDGLFSQAAQIE